MLNLKVHLKEQNVMVLLKKIKSKVFSTFTEWIYKSTEDLCVSV